VSLPSNWPPTEPLEAVRALWATANLGAVQGINPPGVLPPLDPYRSLPAAAPPQAVNPWQIIHHPGSRAKPISKPPPPRACSFRREIIIQLA
jgi:hypothetical protein